VIANAPNPAGFAILRDYFRDRTINPFGLLAAAGADRRHGARVPMVVN
jgi:hypothetical protein